MKSRREKFIFFAVLIIYSFALTFISSYFNNKRGEEQMKNAKPQFEYNTAICNETAILTTQQAVKIICNIEEKQLILFLPGEEIIGTIQAENYKGERTVLKIKNISKFYTPDKVIVGQVKYADLQKRAEEFYYGNAIDVALQDRFIYKVGELAGMIDFTGASIVHPGLESRYEVISSKPNEIVLSTLIDNAIHDGTSTTITYTLKNWKGKWVIAKKELSPRTIGNKTVTFKSKGDDWFVVGTAVPVNK